MELRNSVVNLASEVMEGKLDELIILRQIYKEKGDTDRISALSKRIKQTQFAIKVMRDWEGCWS